MQLSKCRRKERRDKKHSSWWVDPEKWKAMSEEEKRPIWTRSMLPRVEPGQVTVPLSLMVRLPAIQQPLLQLPLQPPLHLPQLTFNRRLGPCLEPWSLLTVVPGLRVLMI